MKQVISMVLSLALALSLAACGQPISERATVPSAPPAPSSAISSAPSSAASSEAEAPSDGYLPGVWDGNVFTSEFLNLEIALPEGWVAATQEELLGMMNLVVDSDMLTDQAKLVQQIAGQSIVYEMMMVDPLTNANVILQTVDLKSIPGGSVLTEKMFIEAQKLGLPQQMNLELEFGEIGELEFASVMYATLPIYVNDLNTYQVMMCGKYGSKMCMIAISAPMDNEEAFDTALDAFNELGATTGSSAAS